MSIFHLNCAYNPAGDLESCGVYIPAYERLAGYLTYSGENPILAIRYDMSTVLVPLCLTGRKFLYPRINYEDVENIQTYRLGGVYSADANRGKTSSQITGVIPTLTVRKLTKVFPVLESTMRRFNF